VAYIRSLDSTSRSAFVPAGLGAPERHLSTGATLLAGEGPAATAPTGGVLAGARHLAGEAGGEVAAHCTRPFLLARYSAQHHSWMNGLSFLDAHGWIVSRKIVKKTTRYLLELRPFLSESRYQTTSTGGTMAL